MVALLLAAALAGAGEPTDSSQWEADAVRLVAAGGVGITRGWYPSLPIFKTPEDGATHCAPFLAVGVEGGTQLLHYWGGVHATYTAMWLPPPHEQSAMVLPYFAGMETGASWGPAHRQIGGYVFVGMIGLGTGVRAILCTDHTARHGVELRASVSPAAVQLHLLVRLATRIPGTPRYRSVGP